MPQKSACFDVLGTSFSFEKAIETIDSRLGSKLQQVNATPKGLLFSWFYAAQRDFTYVSLNDNYMPIAQVLKSTFKRAAQIVDLPTEAVSDEDVEAVMETIRSLPPRPGLKRCLDGLREVGWEVLAVTNGSKETSLDYYKNANIDLSPDHLLSCDDLQVAKPDVRVYEATNEHLTNLGFGSKGDGDRWFVAAHAWDLIAARRAGFKTAWIAFEEHDPVTPIFGPFDLYADDLADLLEKFKKLG